jgi:5-methylcytosine-specific restriction endonuclease McrA
MPGSFCAVCRTRIPKGSRCRRHAVRSPSNRAWHQPGAAAVRASLLGPGACCRVCGSIQDLEVHHVIAAAEGGSTTPENLVVLCRKHHLAVEAEKRTG